MLRSLQSARCALCTQVFQRCLPLVRHKRYFTVQDASAALRPFYFVVHPDLFGQHPTERAVNENSLKLLNEYLAVHPSLGKTEPKEMVFYIRSQDSSGPGLKQVKICLTTSNLRDTVMAILSTCGLSNSHVPESSGIMYGTNRPIEWHHTYYTATGKKNPHSRKAEKAVALTLRSWLQLNIQRSRQHEESVRYIQDDIARLLDRLRRELCLKDIRFDSVWGFHHFRGCLKSFDRLYRDHPDFLKFVLKDRTLVFSNSTGVSRLGEIVLSSEDVPQTWFTLLRSVGAYEAVLHRLPTMEAKLSSLLNGIQVVRREKTHCSVMAEEYELLLNKLLNSLRRCQDHVTSTFQDQDLSGLQLVVEGEASPLMLSSLGQFLIPASVPGSLVVDCIKEHRAKAQQILVDIQGFLKEEEQSRLEAMDALGVSDMKKDESVTPAQMISCCKRLVEEHWRLGVSLADSRLRVSHYYSVMQDGQICIPWDWIGDDD
ncbi:T-cell activation inhibitor, mitochondrial [Aplysia californica]|uniref:T-cell activation inhibitor, mitochondrial n=1 Tax=Aplysia californica TaxID=6500 RepID=A0ABM0K9Y1_APLCA|nr:T-cell activation inhibitor, mitochondrial [Aplysia californica]